MTNISKEALRAWDALAPAELTQRPQWRFHTYREALFIVGQLERRIPTLAEHAGHTEHNLDTSSLWRAFRVLQDSLPTGFARDAGARARGLRRTLGAVREVAAWCRALEGPAGPVTESGYSCVAYLESLQRILNRVRKWLVPADAQIASMSALPRPSADRRTSMPTAIQHASMNDPP